LYGFSVYRVVVWVLCLQSCCMGSLFTELFYGFSVDRVVPIQQLCKPRTHTTTLSTENPYNNSVNREPIQQLCKPRNGFSVYRVVVWVLCLQSCCMGSLFTELFYGSRLIELLREPIQQLCKQRTHTTTL
jgi:hypothetical protein